MMPLIGSVNSYPRLAHPVSTLTVSPASEITSGSQVRRIGSSCSGDGNPPPQRKAIFHRVPRPDQSGIPPETVNGPKARRKDSPSVAVASQSIYGVRSIQSWVVTNQFDGR